jgi:hypothetical protein
MKVSLTWFKTKKQEEFDDLMIENQKIQNAILQRQLENLDKNTDLLNFVSSNLENLAKEEKPKEEAIQKEIVFDIKPYKNVKLVNDVLVVVNNEGEILSKVPATKEDFDLIKVASSYEEVLNVISPKASVEFKEVIEEVQKIVQIKGKLEKLAEFKDFTFKDGSLYLTGINRTLPALMVDEFANIIDSYKDSSLSKKGIEDDLLLNDHYKGLKNFFMWCCLNPHPDVAVELYKFLMKNSFRITKQGFFAALRNVVTVTKSQDNKTDHSKDLLDFVSNAYVKIKAVWKKNPANFIVDKAKDGNGYEFYHYAGEGYYKGLGTLKELYLNLPSMEENRFTDAHTKTFDIRVGKKVSMPYKDCYWSTAECNEAGLHFCSDEIHYVGCGDTSVLVLINPMKVVGIGSQKGRCYEYLPIMTVARDEATTLLHDLDFDTLTLDDDFALGELEELAKMTAEGYVVEENKFSFNIEKIGLMHIVTSLDEMKNEISERIKKVI